MKKCDILRHFATFTRKSSGQAGASVPAVSRSFNRHGRDLGALGGEARVAPRGLRGGRVMGSPLLNPPPVGAEVKPRSERLIDGGPANGSTTTARPWRSSGRAAGGPLSCPRGGRASGSPLLNPPSVREEVRRGEREANRHGPANGSTTTARPWRSSGRAAGGPLSCPRGGRASGSPLLNPPSVREEVRRGEREADRRGAGQWVHDHGSPVAQ